jgi:type II secretory pathway component GspD/PulD (secretin)
MRGLPRIALLTACLSMAGGCAPGLQPLPLNPLQAGTVPADGLLDQAIVKHTEGSFEEAADLTRDALRSGTAYQVMPELLYLLGESELALGNRTRAALSLNLLRTYYPRRWSSLPRREMLDVVVEDWRAQSDPERHQGGYGSRVADAFAGPVATGEGYAGSDDFFRGSRVTNVFYETDILQVLADISAQVDVSIVAAQGVRGLVTMEFSDLPLEECLRRLVVPLGLGYRWMDGYYLVGPAAPDAQGSVLLTETIQIRPRHLLAKDALKLLPEAYQRHARVDDAGGNALTVTGSSGVLESFVSDLATIDCPPRQVMLEALVLELNRDSTRELGIDWEVIGGRGGDSFRIAKLMSAATDSSFMGALFSTGVDGLGAVTDIRVALRALEATGGARVKANPRVATLDGREAKIRVGSEAYYSLLSGSVSYAYYTLQKIATGTTLTITPYVGASSEIIADIAVEVSDVRAAGTNDLPVTSVRQVETRARVDNGESIVIGGLLSETERTRENRVPFLGRIPILGALFGYTSVETGQSEMVVLVTPYIMIHPEELAGLFE